MRKITIETTKRREVVDITDKVNSLLKELKVEDGVCHLFVTHTTCALTTADLDPGTDEDFLDAIFAMFPKGSYRHPHDPSHVSEHIMSSLIGSSITLPVEKRRLILGTW